MPVIDFDVGQLWKICRELLDPDEDRRGVSDTSMLPKPLARWARQRLDWKGRQDIEPFPVSYG